MTSGRLIFALSGTPGFVRATNREAPSLQGVAPETTALSLEGTDTTDEQFAKLPSLERLRCLDLDGTKITDVSVKKLASFPQLEELWLECTAITDSGLGHLHRARRLKFLSVAYTEVSTAAVEALARAVPGLKVSV